MIPGLPQDMLQGSDEEGAQRMKRMIFITDSMTSRELDSDGTPFLELGKDGKPVGLTSRVTRVARGSGTSVREVEELLCQYRMMANMAKQAGGKNGWYAYPVSDTISAHSRIGCKQCRRSNPSPAARASARTACPLPHKYKQFRYAFHISR